MIKERKKIKRINFQFKEDEPVIIKATKYQEIWGLENLAESLRIGANKGFDTIEKEQLLINNNNVN